MHREYCASGEKSKVCLTVFGRRMSEISGMWKVALRPMRYPSTNMVYIFP